MDWKRFLEFIRTDKRAWLLLGGATLTLIIVVWFVYDGFSFGTSRFFASEFSGACTFAEKDLPECACSAANRKDLCHVCTDPYKEGNTDYSDAQWLAWDNLGLCRPTCPQSKFPYETERTRADGSRFAFPEYCVEKPTDCPAGFLASGDSRCDAEPAPSVTPTPGNSCPAIPAASSVKMASLAVQCGAGGNVLTWQNPLSLNAGVNSVVRTETRANGTTETRFVFTEGGCWNTFGINTFTDTSLTATSKYTYAVKTHPEVRSNDVFCGATSAVNPSGVPTPAPSVTPPLTGVVCVPGEQLAQVNQIARLEASGGNGTYQWGISGGGVQQGGNASSLLVSYSVPGRKVVTLASGGLLTRCFVEVVTELPAPQASTLTISKRATNVEVDAGQDRSAVSVSQGQTLRFKVRVDNTGNQAVENVVLRDVVPAGMSYVIGSTTVDGSPIIVDAITSQGISIGRIPNGFGVTVSWSAIANAVNTIPAGPSVSRPEAVVSASGMMDTRAGVDVTVSGVGGSGVGSGPGGVQTGPGDAVFLAMIVAALLTLLYSGYTRSSVYRRHEVDVLSEDQGPMDFRG